MSANPEFPLPLPDNLSPLVSNHPAGAAYRVTLPPHEWLWTQAETLAMAKAVVVLDHEREMLRQQRDQVLHLLRGGELTEAEVKRTGLGIGALIEADHYKERLKRECSNH